MYRLLAGSLSLALCLCGADRPHRLNGGPITRLRIPVWTEPADAGLKAADFAASINGKPAAISGILTPDSDLVILLVLDLTGDIALIEPAKQALVAEIGKLPTNAWIGLLHAQEGLRVLADPTPDRESVSNAIESLAISGKAGLLDTVDEVGTIAESVLRKSDVRLAVLYVTDSDINNYREDFTNPVINSSDPHDLSRRFPDALVQEKVSRLQRQLAHSAAPLFVIHLQYRSSGLNQSYQNAIETLAGSTAGYGAFCRSTGDIGETIGKTFAYIRSSYFLTLVLPERRPSLVQIRLESKGAREKSMRLAYRARLVLKEK